MESSKRTNVIVWTSIAAAAAGIAAVAAVMKYRERHLNETGLTLHLRDVQDVLTDCYVKIQDIEARLPDIGSGGDQLNSTSASARVSGNGHLVTDG